MAIIDTAAYSVSFRYPDGIKVYKRTMGSYVKCNVLKHFNILHVHSVRRDLVVQVTAFGIPDSDSLNGYLYWLCSKPYLTGSAAEELMT